eukprot:gene36522-47575_t
MSAMVTFENRPLATMVAIIMFNVIIIYAGVFNYNLSILIPLSDTPLYKAFKDPTFIYFGLILNISTSIPTLVDLFLDAEFYQDMNLESDAGEENRDDSWLERFFISVLNVVTGSIVLLLRNYENVPYVYASVHAVQFVGSMGMVLLICKKLIPNYFTTFKVFSVQLLFSLASITSMLGFGQEIIYWPNIVTFALILGFFYILIWKICAPWLIDLRARIIIGNETLTTQELCSLWYFMSTLIIIIFVPGIVATLKLYDWSDFDIWDVYIFVYSFAIYGIIISTIPGRLARFAVDRERKNLVESKRELIRYFSHEVRSPLNVICSGLTFLLGDISKLPASSEKSSLLEMATSVRQASEDVVKITNDLLQMESMDAAAFSIVEEMVPCSELSQLADTCSVVAREKGIVFAVNNQFEEKPADDVKNQESSAALHDLLDIETGSNKAKEPVEQNTVDLMETSSRKSGKSDKNGLISSRKKKKYKAYADKNGYSFAGHVTIEIADTGAGIAEANWDKIFGQFKQFDANKLQGGGCSGLGLWICQQVVKLHGSEIQFHSDGEDCGTKFYFTLPCYNQMAPVPSLDPVPIGIVPVTVERSIVTPTLILNRAAAQVSPELSQLPQVDQSNAEISSIPPLRLSTRGVCKVLVVDDSRPNVKIVIRLINQASALCPHLSGGGDRRGVAIDKSLLERQMGTRSSIYIQSLDEDPPEEVAVKFVCSEAGDGVDAVKMVQEASEGGAAQVMRSGGFKGRIIGVTGNVLPQDVKDYIQHGADYIMGKPVRINELKQILERIVV